MSDALKAAGLPPKDSSTSRDIIIPKQSTPPRRILPITASDNLSEISGSESESPENSPGSVLALKEKDWGGGLGVKIL